ncbi:MAG: FecR domain-containing protein [Bacteroidales bacterium]|nr:FecR domain-containing protein [Bacteroidales bacterium]
MLLEKVDVADEQELSRQAIRHPEVLNEYRFMQHIWNEAARLQLFEQIDAHADWKRISDKLDISVNPNYRKIPIASYFLRVAALVVLTFGLSYGFYRLVLNHEQPETSAGFITYQAQQKLQHFVLPDGSSVNLNVGSDLTLRDDFGKNSREVILEGEALFKVLRDPSRPFRVYTGESVIEVTGTEFAVCEVNGMIQVSVLSGTVMFSSTDSVAQKISLKANQSGYLHTNNDIHVEDRIPANTLSWKTGHLSFDQTPIDSAITDIARHFHRNLSFDVVLQEKITAEFQDQPLHEILKELELVAGLKFDTTGTALIVRK